ncbi:MAG: Rieske 2Fe-2S domain-containing protein [Planctomycetaceae bacterium]|nr:Rieske 2Fe-2S domain-containing protein [Planctomycetaceae bacterium]
MWHAVCSPNEISDGKGDEFTVAGRIVAVYRIGEEFHAMDGICAHAGGPVGKGMLRGCVVTCPWHGWQFDVTTGQHCLTPQIRQETFGCKVEGDQVWVELPDA